jgi:hypothetical protein
VSACAPACAALANEGGAKEPFMTHNDTPRFPVRTSSDGSAVLDSAHIGDIRGAFGTIARGDTRPARACATACARCSRS